MFLHNTSIQRKVTVVVMSTTTIALLIAFATLFIFEVREFRRVLQREITSISEIVGANLTAALEFDDKKAGTQILSALSKDPRIESAAVYNENGELFARYDIESISAIPLPNTFNGLQKNRGPKHTLKIKEITLGEHRVGTIVIQATDKQIKNRLLEYSLILCAALLTALFGAYILSSILRKFIAAPIIHLADTARQIATSNNYSVRATKTSNDETGVLIDQFNTMLDRIKELNEALELRVEERTLALEQSQERLRRSERLASIGTLAAGIAHEIRNPLNSIHLAAQYALKKTSDKEFQDVFKIIASEAVRSSNIIKNVMLFAKSEQTIKTPHNLIEVVNHAIDLAKTYSEEKFLVELDAPSEPITIVMNPTEIEQVIVNLVNNAVEASPSTAVITIKILPEPTKVVLLVTDKGPGIPQEILNHIFDPFFSTKRKLGNTGLGLSLTHGIIGEHNGTMSVESAVGVGTTFKIEFPRVENG